VIAPFEPWRFDAACDPEVLRPSLEHGLERNSVGKVQLVDLEVPRVFPRPHGGLTLQLSGRAQREGASELVPVVLGGHLLGAFEGWPEYTTIHDDKVLRFEKLRLVVPLFPYDPNLWRLPQLLREDLALALLRRAGVAGLDDASALVPRLLGYRLERRCVVHHRPLSGSKRTAAAALVTKALRPSRVAALQNAVQTLITAGAEDLAPKTLLLDPRRGLYVMEEAPGRSLRELVPQAVPPPAVMTPEFASGCEAAGRALARLHALPKEAFPRRCVADALRPLDGLVELARQLLPQWSEELGRARDSVFAKAPSDLQLRDQSTVHGDFYDKQVLYRAGRATVLDWDGLACGDPARDHGNFTAHVALRAEQTPECAAEIERGAVRFDRGYGSSSSEFAARARWWEAATLVRLVALYGLRRRWQHLVPALLRRSGRSLESLSGVAMLLALMLTGIPRQARGQSPEYMKIKPHVGQALEISGAWSDAGLFVASDIQVLPEPRSPQLRGALEAVDVEKRTLVVYGVRLQLTDGTKADSTESAGAALAALQPGQRIEVSCAVDERGTWTVRRLNTSTVKASDKIKGTTSRAAVDGAAPDTLEISGLRILLTAKTQVKVPQQQQQEVRRERDLFPDLARRDRTHATASLAGNRMRFLGEYRGHARSRTDYDLSRRYDSDASEGSSELRLGFAGYWSESLWTFAQMQISHATALDPEELLRPRLEGRLTQLYALFHTRGAHRVALQVGRQDFDEPREWIFDEYLDAARLVLYGFGPLVVEAAFIRPYHPINPAFATWSDGFAMARWYFNSQNHVAVWGLARSDRNPVRERQPVWIGARYLGQWRGTVRPWLDLASMRGEDKHRTLRAWAFDAGATCVATGVRGMPALTVGYAVGSGDASTADGVDGNFRQTGYEDNWSRFGGLVSQKIYGTLLDPELSNLEVSTLGVAARPMRDASVELIWHRYRQQAAYDKLQGSNLVDPPARPNGASADLGWTVEVVAAAPALWGRLRASWTTAFFRPGDAYNPRHEDAILNRLDLTAWF